jgi:hypothetical protein
VRRGISVAVDGDLVRASQDAVQGYNGDLLSWNTLVAATGPTVGRKEEAAASREEEPAVRCMASLSWGA